MCGISEGVKALTRVEIQTIFNRVAENLLDGGGEMDMMTFVVVVVGVDRIVTRFRGAIARIAVTVRVR